VCAAVIAMALPKASSSIVPTMNDYEDVSELEKYKHISNIGKGSFGVISKVQRIEDGKVSGSPPTSPHYSFSSSSRLTLTGIRHEAA
jgi:hypothetical protein